jgi:hypothetical protein
MNSIRYWKQESSYFADEKVANSYLPTIQPPKLVAVSVRGSQVSLGVRDQGSAKSYNLRRASRIIPTHKLIISSGIECIKIQAPERAILMTRRIHVLLGGILTIDMPVAGGGRADQEEV